MNFYINTSYDKTVSCNCNTNIYLFLNASSGLEACGPLSASPNYNFHLFRTFELLKTNLILFVSHVLDSISTIGENVMK